MNQNYRIIDLAKNLHNKTAKNVEHLSISCPASNQIGVLADLCMNYTD